MDGYPASRKVASEPSSRNDGKIVQTRHISDLVLDSKLETEISNTYTQHVRYIHGHPSSGQRMRVVERWIRENPLGRGSYGTVYRERCEEDQSKLRAVKEIGKYTMEWEKLDYTRELEAIFKFSHPRYSHRFVRADGWFENDVSVFISMEYLSLGDLGRYLSRPLPEREVQNIIVVNTGPDWVVKIADFGISKRRWQDSTTTSTIHRGTLAFAAPEQLGFGKANNGGSLIFLSDMWSLGAVTYKLLSNNIPFSGLPDLMNYLSGQLSFPVECLQSKGVSKVAQKLLVDLLSPEPHQRPSARLCREHLWTSMQLPLTTTESAATSTEDCIIQDETIKSFEASAVWSEEIDHKTHITFLNEPPESHRILSTPGPPTKTTKRHSGSVSLLANESSQSIASESASESHPRTPRPLRKVSRHTPSSTAIWGQNVSISIEESLQGLADESTSESRPNTPKPLPKATGHNPSSTSIPVEDHPQGLGTPNVPKSVESGRQVQYLEKLFKYTGGTEDSKRRTRLIQSLADRLVNNCTLNECSDSYCAFFPARWRPGPKNWLTRAERFEQQQAPNFPDIVQFLRSYVHNPSTVMQKEGPTGSEDLGLHFKLRIRLSGALMLLRKESEATQILEEDLEWTLLPLIHQAASHQYAAQAYSMQSNWEKAKLHAVQAFQQTSGSLGRPSDSNKACLKLMVDICNKRMDPGEEAQITDITGAYESPVQTRIRYCKDLMAMLDPLAAADLGVEFLRTNFDLRSSVLPSKGFPCWSCIKEHMLSDGAFLGGFRKGAACPGHRSAFRTLVHGVSTQRSSDYTGLSPVHFLAIATPLTKRWQPRRSCAEELEWILQQSVTEPLMYDNTTMHYYVPEATGRAIEMTPLWLAAAHGKSEVVDLLLSRQTNLACGATTLCLLPRLGSYNKHQQESIAKALKPLSQMEARKLLDAQGPSNRHWTESPWFFQSPQLLDVVLEACGKESGNLSVPFKLRDRQHLINLPLICALLTTFTVDPYDAIELLNTLILHGADPNAKDPFERMTLELVLRRNQAMSHNLGLPELRVGESFLQVALIQLLLSHGASPPSRSDFRREVNLLRVKPYNEPRVEELRRVEKEARHFLEQKNLQQSEESTIKSTLNRLCSDLGFNITEYDSFEEKRCMLDAQIDTVLEMLIRA